MFNLLRGFCERTDLNFICGYNQIVMHKDKYVFAQLVQFLDRSKFNRIVVKYQ